MRAAGWVAGGILSILSALACADSVSNPVLGEVPEWKLRRGVAIGSPDDPVYGLWAPGEVLADDDRVYVLLVRDATIRVFTRDGVFVRDLGGGRGAGPGEMMRPGFMGWYGPGTIAIGDGELRRFTFYEIATGEAETVPYQTYLSAAHGTAALEPAVALPGRRAANFPLPTDATRGRSIPTTSPMVVLDTVGRVRDTLALLSMPVEAEITAGVADGGALHISHPLEQYGLWQFAPDRSRVAIVDRRSWTGTGPAEFGVTTVDPEGDTLFHRQIAYDPRPVPGGYYDREIAGFLDLPIIMDRAAFADALRQFFEQIRYLPSVTDLTVGSDRTIWLAGADRDGEREWLVLDPSGAGIGRFRLPSTSSVFYADRNEAWIVERDALDIPYVVRYEILP